MKSTFPVEKLWSN